MTRHRLLLLTVAGTVLFSLGTVPATAEEPPGTEIVVGLETALVENLSDYATATLRTLEASPIGGVPVVFRLQVDLLGDRFAFLGTATTDATGVARVPIVGRQRDHVVAASFAGNEAFQSSEATALVRFPESRVVPVVIERPESQLATLRTVMPRVLGAVVAFLWVFFVWATVYVVRSVRHAGLGPERQ